MLYKVLKPIEKSINSINSDKQHIKRRIMSKVKIQQENEVLVKEVTESIYFCICMKIHMSPGR